MTQRRKNACFGFAITAHRTPTRRKQNHGNKSTFFEAVAGFRCLHQLSGFRSLHQLSTHIGYFVVGASCVVAMGLVALGAVGAVVRRWRSLNTKLAPFKPLFFIALLPGVFCIQLMPPNFSVSLLFHSAQILISSR